MNHGNGGTVKIVAPMTRKADVIVALATNLSLRDERKH